MTPSREPLAIRGAIVAAVTAILHLAVMSGALPIAPDVEGQAALVLDLIGTAVLVVWTRGAVTPVDDPRDTQGRPLTPDVEPTPGGYVGRHRPAADPTVHDRLSSGEEG